MPKFETTCYPESTEAMGTGVDTRDDGQGKANRAGPIPTDKKVVVTFWPTNTGNQVIILTTAQQPQSRRRSSLCPHQERRTKLGNPKSQE